MYFDIKLHSATNIKNAVFTPYLQPIRAYIYMKDLLLIISQKGQVRLTPKPQFKLQVEGQQSLSNFNFDCWHFSQHFVAILTEKRWYPFETVMSFKIICTKLLCLDLDQSKLQYSFEYTKLTSIALISFIHKFSTEKACIGIKHFQFTLQNQMCCVC